MQEYLIYDICGVLSMVTVIIAMILRKLNKGRNSMLFLALCLVLLMSGILDIVTEYLDNLEGLSDYYTLLRTFLNVCYFLFQNACLPLYLAYSCSIMGLWKKLRSEPFLHTLWVLPYTIEALFIVSSPWTHLIFYIDRSDFSYRYGSLIILPYAVALYYMILCAWVIISNRKLLSKPSFWILIAFLPINAGSLFIQLLFGEYRIAIFMQILFTVTVNLTIQRPEDMVDYVVGVQSSSAFLATVHTAFDAGRSVNYLLIKFENIDSIRENMGIDEYMKILRKFANKIERISKAMTPGLEVYYLNQGFFAVVDDNGKYDQLLDAGRTIMAYLLEPVLIRQMEIKVIPRICIVKCPEDVGNENSFLNIANRFHHILPNDNSVVILSQVANTKDFRIRSEMDSIIKRGLEEHRFEMYYQPIYSVEKKKYLSAEALIRLNDSVYGFISPGVFIPAAEESGAIHDIGDFVINEVCRFIGSSGFVALGLKYIELNLSIAQFIEVDLPDKLDAAMKRYGVRPDQLNLEITETAADYNPEITDINIEKIRAMGLSFSLDDYGTGYSNISRVAMLPISIVKLDKSLVDDMDSYLMWVTIKNTVKMLKKLDKKILVEGIEDKKAFDRFAEIGCDYIQGYYFSRPLSEKDFVKFICQS